MNESDKFTEKEFEFMKKGGLIECPFCGKKFFGYTKESDIGQGSLFHCSNCNFGGMDQNGPGINQLLGNRSKKEFARRRKVYLEADIKEMEFSLKVLWKTLEKLEWRRIKRQQLAELKNRLLKFRP